MAEEEEAAGSSRRGFDATGKPKPYGGTQEAKSNFEEQKKLREEAKKKYVSEQTAKTREAKENAQKIKAITNDDKRKVSSSEKAARVQEGYKVDQYGNYVDKLGNVTENKNDAVKSISGIITSIVSGGRGNAAAIRAAAREKTSAEKIAEEAKKMTAADEEAKKANEPSVEAPATKPSTTT